MAPSTAQKARDTCTSTSRIEHVTKTVFQNLLPILKIYTMHNKLLTFSTGTEFRNKHDDNTNITTRMH